MHLGLIIGKGSYTSYSALTLSFKVQGGKSLELNPDYRVYRNIQGKKKKKKKKRQKNERNEASHPAGPD